MDIKEFVLMPVSMLATKLANTRCLFNCTKTGPASTQSYSVTLAHYKPQSLENNR